MAVIYVDSVFLLNALMDYLLLLMTARIAGLTLRRGRYALSALLGGAHAVAVFLPGCAWLASAPVKLGAGILLALISFGGEAALFRLILLFFALSCAMAGSILGLSLLASCAIPAANGILYTNINGKLLTIAAAGGYLTARFAVGALAGKGLRGRRLPVLLENHGRRCACTALWDTGNGLRDIRGKPVLVTELRAVSSILPPNVACLLRQNLPADELLAPLRALAPDSQPQLISYRSLGRSDGILLSLRVERAYICGEEQKNLRIALSPKPLGNGYQALWGGDVKKEKRYGYFSMDRKAPAKDQSAFKGRGSLYRWQRQHASAAEPGEGSGIAGAPGSGGGPSGNHRAQSALGGLYCPPL